MPLVRYASGADATGYPRPLLTHPPSCPALGHPGTEARRRRRSVLHENGRTSSVCEDVGSLTLASVM